VVGFFIVQENLKNKKINFYAVKFFFYKLYANFGILGANFAICLFMSNFYNIIMPEVIEVLYQIYHKAGQTRTFIEPNSGCILRYYSKREMNRQYQDKNFNIIGEIGCYGRPPNKADYLLVDSLRKIPIYPRGSIIKPFEWVIGYTAVGENSYLAVVRSLLCWFMR